MGSFLAAARRAACVVLVVLIGSLTVDPAVASETFPVGPECGELRQSAASTVPPGRARRSPWPRQIVVGSSLLSRRIDARYRIVAPQPDLFARCGLLR